jgi:hypothetical protein
MVTKGYQKGVYDRVALRTGTNLTPEPDLKLPPNCPGDSLESYCIVSTQADSRPAVGPPRGMNNVG